MTGLLLASLAALVVIALMLLAARDIFRQTAVLSWTPDDDLQVRRLLGADSGRR
jgi:hypothetical protein